MSDLLYGRSHASGGQCIGCVGGRIYRVDQPVYVPHKTKPTPLRPGAYEVTVDGESFRSVTRAAAALGIDAASLNGRLRTGKGECTVDGKRVECPRIAELVDGSKPKPVLIDGVRYESVKAGAELNGLNPNGLRSALSHGRLLYKGHRVEYAPEKES